MPTSLTSVNTSGFVSVQDGLRIATFEWPASTGEVRGVVQIAHGLAEHSARYGRLAAALNAAGYHVGSTDHRGHGASIVGVPGDFGPAGFPGLWHDVVQYGDRLRDAHPGLPVYLIAHSMGSFAAQELLPEYSERYDGVVLTGSTALDVVAAQPPSGPAGDLSVFNADFEHRTGYEWLSRDDAEVDAYVADPWCGFSLPAETTPTWLVDSARLADPTELAGIRPDLPLLIISGSDDPLSGGGHLPRLLAQRYTDAGVADVTVIVYPGARHEVFNETNRDEVTGDVVSWLQTH